MDCSLPDGWEEKTLKEVTSILGDGLHGTPKYSSDGEYFFINGNNLVNGKIVINEKTKKCSKEEYEKYKKNLNNRTILVSINGTLGNIAVYNNEKVFLGKSACYFNVLEDIDKDFIKYTLHTNYFKYYIDTYATGTTIKNMPLKAMREFNFFIPKDKKEQKRIADILSAFDDKIELNNQMNQTLEEMATALFKEWFENFNFPNSEGNLYKDNGGEMKITELGEIPIDWEVKSLDDVLDLIIDHRGKTPKKLGGDWVENGIKAISAKHIKDLELINIENMNQVDDAMYNKWMKEKLKSKDILMTSEAPLGELYFLFNQKDYVLSQRVYGIRANESKIIPELLFYSLKSNLVMNDILSRATGSTVQGIKQTELRQVKIIVPSGDIQKEMYQVFENILDQKSNNIEQNQILKKQRDTLLPKLLSGEIRV